MFDSDSDYDYYYNSDYSSNYPAAATLDSEYYSELSERLGHHAPSYDYYCDRVRVDSVGERSGGGGVTVGSLFSLLALLVVLTLVSDILLQSVFGVLVTRMKRSSELGGRALKQGKISILIIT